MIKNTAHNGGENKNDTNAQLLSKFSLKVPVAQVLKITEIASNPEHSGHSSCICSEVVCI